MTNYEIRKIEERDYARLAIIEKICFVSPWTKEQIKGEVECNQFANFYVFEVEENTQKTIIGYYDYWVTFDSATIAQIAVIPEYRKQGIASIMMQEIIDDCYAKRVRNLTLEVRKNNAKAQRLYEKFGFKAILLKPHYYDNGDDAIYMIKEINLNG